ncbi:YjgN family protein [Sphingomonas endolithica]|uniref:YjgN family protein n=1 Tax=Sphingomonas endolithica TaxID=2972485 RepID=UPI0021AE6250|nr:YjgN family protein [Sphingomonas sp. ZFBP2030]
MSDGHDHAPARAPETEGGAFGFTGTWQQFAPIAFTNLALTIVTLGIYSFWARTRVRRYLWSETRFIDDRLEWTGTGLELFIGYLLAFVLILVPLGVIQLVVQGIVLRGHPGAAGLMVVVLYIALLYLVGIAVFRALRYRLSRTFWHGIRGGSDDQGLGYGWQYLWRTLCGGLVLGLLIPWSMTSLWNERWNKMSFGPLRFEAAAEAGKLMPRFLLFYLVPILLFGGGIAAAFMFHGEPSGLPTPSSVMVIGFLLVFVFYGVLGAVALFFYSAYFREAIGTLSLGDLEFQFTARTWDWAKLMLGNIALVICTLGIGYIFLAYRNWAFFIRHLHAFGSVHLDDLTQSGTREPGQGEGLLDAFDIGAF